MGPTLLNNNKMKYPEPCSTEYTGVGTYYGINSYEIFSSCHYKQLLSALIDDEEMRKFLRETDDILCEINAKISLVWSHQY